MISPTRQFVLGILFGMSITFFLNSYVYIGHYRTAQPRQQLHASDISMAKTHKDTENFDEFSKVIRSPAPKLHLGEDKHMHHDDDSVARKMFEQVRVLVWVMTHPDNLDTRAKTVKETWGKRCNKLLFFSSEDNAEIPTIGLNVTEGREHLTAKVMRGFRYVYKHFFDQFDWFIKTDDDTYVIVENLRYFLSGQNTSEPVYFGHLFKTIVKQGYYSGSTEVLSKEALRRLAEQGYDSTICEQDGEMEDVNLGDCMEKLGVRTANSTDALGRSRIHCLDPETHLFGDYPDWYYEYDANGAKKGQENISDYAISFHYVSPEKMFAIEFYLYHLRPYGISSGHQSLNVENRNKIRKEATNFKPIKSVLNLL